MKRQLIIFGFMVGISGHIFAQEQKDTTQQERRVKIIIRQTGSSDIDSDTIVIRKNSNIKSSNHIKRTDNEWVFDLGINNYLEHGNFPSNEDGKHYAVKNAIKYVAISSLIQTHIGGDKSPLFFNTGLEISWNGFMFKEDVRIERGVDHAEVNPVLDANGNPVGLKKSKLGITYLSIPAMFVMDFNKAHQGKFKFGLGGYAGLRIKSWSKIKKDDGSKERNPNNFYLNDFRYGIMGEIGYSWVTFFVKYDLNPLFRAGKGFDPNEDLNALNVGVRL